MELAPLNNSVMFKKLFRNPDILTEFFKDLTGIQLHLTADNIELEKKFTPPLGLIDIAFDIFAEDPERRVIVEIQRVHYHYLIDRFDHYHQAAIMEMQRSYQQYTPDRTVYTIVWLTMAAEANGELARDENGTILRFHARIKATQWISDQIDLKVGAERGEWAVWRFPIVLFSKETFINPLGTIDVNAQTGEVLPLPNHQIHAIREIVCAAKQSQTLTPAT